MDESALQTIVTSSRLRHVAIIMDGNGRWALAQNKQRIEGHHAGAQTVRRVVETSRRLGIRHLTLFSFSSENWQRPREEVSGLMSLFSRYLKSELKTLLENGVRLRAAGDLERLPRELRELLQENIERTANLDGMDLILAISYGGREEIVRAAKRMGEKLLSGELALEEVDERLFPSFLDLPDVPDPDLLIRTGNEHRISNFLLWQLAYAEIIFCPTFWPDFSNAEYHDCIVQFGRRMRRFGLTGEQAHELGV